MEKDALLHSLRHEDLDEGKDHGHKVGGIADMDSRHAEGQDATHGAGEELSHAGVELRHAGALGINEDEDPLLLRLDGLHGSMENVPEGSDHAVRGVF